MHSIHLIIKNLILFAYQILRIDNKKCKNKGIDISDKFHGNHMIKITYIKLYSGEDHHW
jgi:hypothetical protein